MIRVEYANQSHEILWNEFVFGNSAASIYHSFSFRTIISDSFNRDPFYLIAIDTVSGKARGILPLYFFTGPIAGRCLVSLPFFDGGGLCADDKEAAQILITEAMALMRKHRCASCELRQEGRLPFEKETSATIGIAPEIISSKVRMLLDLPESPDDLFKSFPAKLRSQIRKPTKEQCSVHEGGLEMVDEFYRVLGRNMRDLGSPIESKRVFHNAIARYPGLSRIFVVYWKEIPVACSFIFGFKNRIVNRWASTNRDYKRLAPNMLLYWRMLEYAIQNGYSVFDFGRSTLDGSTFHFKEQWGAQPHGLFWYSYRAQQNHAGGLEDAASAKKAFFMKVWSKLPVSLATALGPMVRRHITL